MSTHCVWLDRQAITSHLCLPMTTKPKKNKNAIKTNNTIYTVDSQTLYRQYSQQASSNLGIIQKHSIRCFDRSV